MSDYNNSTQRSVFGLLSAVFFIWGCLTSLNGVLVPYLKNVFGLSYTESMLVQTAFYLAPFLACLPMASLIKAVGYKKALVSSLLLVAAGCLLFIPASYMASFSMILMVIFVTAMGIASIQVVANPCIAMIGPEKEASSRLSLASAANSLGTTVAPFAGSLFLFSTSVMDTTPALSRMAVPYVVCALVVIAIAGLVLRLNIPEPNDEQTSEPRIKRRTWHYRHLNFGILAIFCYVGVEVSVGTFILSYFSTDSLGGMTLQSAGKLVAIYWGCAMAGRLAGSLIFQKAEAQTVLMFSAFSAILLLMVVMLLPGRLGVIACITIGLANSIMYPAIFSLSLRNLGSLAGQASALLVMAGVGGGLWPLIQAVVADRSGLLASFIVPVVGYIVIAVYGAFGYKPVTGLDEKTLSIQDNYLGNDFASTEL